MAIVGALDIHGQQITFDWIDHHSGESGRGRVSPADRVGLRKWLGQFGGKPVELVVEGPDARGTAPTPPRPTPEAFNVLTSPASLTTHQCLVRAAGTP